MVRQLTQLTQNNSRPPRKSYAMIMFVVVLTLAVTLSSVVLLSVDADRKSSKSQTNKDNARALAMSALNDFYAYLQETNSYTVDDNWYMFGDTGRQNCPQGPAPVGDDLAFAQPCYRVQVSQEANEDGILTTDVLKVTVTVRNACVNNTSTGCRYTAFEQRLRKRDFLTFLYYTQFSTIDPQWYSLNPALVVASGFSDAAQAQALCADRYASSRPPGFPDARDPRCVEVSFQGQGVVRDIVNGSVYTLDDYVSVCGNPEFHLTGKVDPPTVQAHGPGSLPDNKVFSQNSLQCAALPDPTFNPAQPGSDGTNAPEINLPQPSLATPLFKAIAPESFQLTVTNPTSTVSFTPDGHVHLSTTSPAQTQDLGLSPSVVFIENATSVNVTGQASRPVTVYATGDVNLPGDLRVNSTPTCEAPTAADPVIGVASASQVRIAQAASGSQRCIQASLAAFGGSVAVSDWFMAQVWPAGAPTLNFHGSLVGKYQPVFGGFDGDTGALFSGFRKNFHYDERLSDDLLQPPYLLAPLSGADQEKFDVTAKWARLDTSEVALSKGCIDGMNGNFNYVC